MAQQSPKLKIETLTRAIDGVERSGVECVILSRYRDREESTSRSFSLG